VGSTHEHYKSNGDFEKWKDIKKHTFYRCKNASVSPQLIEYNTQELSVIIW
jgi:hypothetical protein